MSDYPPDWSVANLGEIATIKASNVDKKSKDGQRDILLCNYMDVFKNSAISNSLAFMRSTASDKEISDFCLSKGDVLLTKDSEVPEEIGIPSVVAEDIPDLVCGYHLYMLRPDSDRIDPGYLCWALRSNESRQYFYQMANGSTRFGLNLKHVEECSVPIPPLPEQKKIAEILSGIDHEIKATQLALSRHEIANNASVFNQISILASDEENLRSVEEVSSRITDGEHQTPPRTSHGVFLLSARNVRDGFISVSDVDYISEETHQRLSRRISPCQDDLLISCSGSVGRCCLVPAGMKFSMVRSVALVKPERSLICPAYLLAAFSSEFVQRQIRSSLSQLAQANLFQGAIKKITIPVPPLEEQERIGKLFSTGKDYCKHLRQKTEKLELLKQGVTSDLLSGRKRVSV